MFRRMTEQEIAIRKINNLRMVAVYEFTEAVRRGEADSRSTDADRDGCTAVTVLYGDNEQITLSEFDPYYEVLIERLFSLYGEMEDPLSVMMNEKTRALFESGRYSEEAHFQREFLAKKSTAMPALPFHSRDSRMFLPVVTFVLRAACGILEREATVVSQTCGWRGRGAVTLHSRGADTLLPVEVAMVRDREYRIRVGEWPEPGRADSLQIDVSWDNSGMEAAFATHRGNLTGRFSCQLSEDGAEMLYEASRDGKQVYYNREKIPAEPVLKAVPEKLRGLLPAGVSFAAAYRLPMGIVYVVSREAKQYRDIDKIDYCAALLFPEAEYAEIRAWTRVENRSTQVILRKNSVRMKRAVLDDGRIQTYFEPEIAGASGIYKTGLAGRYFLSE